MIGIFDSGLGGLTVASAIVDQVPAHDILYFGDTARTPYGTKSQDTVIGYAIQNTEFLLKKGATMIVMACNTASSVATEILKKRFDVPIFEVIVPAIEKMLSLKNVSQIGVIGTRATINSRAYETRIKEINPNIKVYSYACPLLVPLVEEGWLNRPETRMIVKKYVHPLKVRQIDTLILGCTHYPLLKSVIQKKIGRKVRIVDSAQSVAQHVKSYLEQNNLLKQGQNGAWHFYVSDITPHFETIAKSIFHRNLTLQKVDIELTIKKGL